MQLLLLLLGGKGGVHWQCHSPCCRLLDPIPRAKSAPLFARRRSCPPSQTAGVTVALVGTLSTAQVSAPRWPLLPPCET
eukprot:6382398-Amphidinium_carterae.1